MRKCVLVSAVVLAFSTAAWGDVVSISCLQSSFTAVQWSEQIGCCVPGPSPCLILLPRPALCPNPVLCPLLWPCPNPCPVVCPLPVVSPCPSAAMICMLSATHGCLLNCHGTFIGVQTGSCLFP